MSRNAGVAPRYRIGVDIGGTFTDVVVVNEIDGSVNVTKVSTVPSDPSEGFLSGLAQALAALQKERA